MREAGIVDFYFRLDDVIRLCRTEPHSTQIDKAAFPFFSKPIAPKQLLASPGSGAYHPLTLNSVVIPCESRSHANRTSPSIVGNGGMVQGGLLGQGPGAAVADSAGARAVRARGVAQSARASRAAPRRRSFFRGWRLRWARTFPRPVAVRPVRTAARSRAIPTGPAPAASRLSARYRWSRFPRASGGAGSRWWRATIRRAGAALPAAGCCTGSARPGAESSAGPP